VIAVEESATMLPASILTEREILYLLKQDGCEACAAALPEFDRFLAKHPSVTALVYDANGPFAAQLGVKIRSTPTYVFRRGGEVVKIAEGALRLADLERAMKKLGAQL
jgi:thiol-disulfide isomerase/thioredoxin